MSDIWSRLAAPFAPSDLEWRIIKLSADKLSAYVRPQLRPAAVLKRLDEAVTVSGWSNTLSLNNEAVACTLTIAGVSKSVAVSLLAVSGDAATRADDAMVYAAERFGLLPAADIAREYIVDFDPESGELLYEPTPPTDSWLKPPEPVALAAKQEDKLAGRLAIDRLLERLKTEGLGLEAAKLLIAYGGYGSDSLAARELYSKLRELLLQREIALKS